MGKPPSLRGCPGAAWCWEGAHVPAGPGTSAPRKRASPAALRQRVSTPTRVCSLALWDCEDPTSWRLVTLGSLPLEFTQSFWLQLGARPPPRPQQSSGDED